MMVEHFEVVRGEIRVKKRDRFVWIENGNRPTCRLVLQQVYLELAHSGPSRCFRRGRGKRKTFSFTFCRVKEYKKSCEENGNYHGKVIDCFEGFVAHLTRYFPIWWRIIEILWVFIALRLSSTFISVSRLWRNPSESEVGTMSSLELFFHFCWIRKIKSWSLSLTMMVMTNIHFKQLLFFT